MSMYNIIILFRKLKKILIIAINYCIPVICKINICIDRYTGGVSLSRRGRSSSARIQKLLAQRLLALNKRTMFAQTFSGCSLRRVAPNKQQY